MTRKEALLILDPPKGRKDSFSVYKWHDAIRMACAALRAQAEAEKNEPLTIEQLRQMDGEPVYLVSTVHEQDTGWVIIKSSVVDSHGCRYLVTSDGFYAEDCFIRGDVKAYRRKPEEGGRNDRLCQMHT